jgi:hypothetical protein
MSALLAFSRNLRKEVAVKFFEYEAGWAEDFFGGCELGDKRRTRRLVKVAAALATSPGAAVDAAFGGDGAGALGAHRLLRNSRVEAEDIFEAGASKVAQLGRECKGTLLAVEDTTALSFRSSGCGEVGGGRQERWQRQWLVHSVVLLREEDRYPLGVIEQRRWIRDPRMRGKRHLRRRLGYEEKESIKWERASVAVERRLGAEAMKRVVTVADRESDVYEYLQYKLERGQRFVVRSSWDRRLCGGGRLRAEVGSWPVRGKVLQEVAQRGGRARRQVFLSVRYGQVKLGLPRRERSTVRKELSLWVVHLREEGAAAGVGLEWYLFTSEAVEDFEQAQRIIGYYRARWQIEDWHKAWKSGCMVEKRRQRTADKLEKLVVLTAFVAVRLLQLRQMAQRAGEESCEKMFDSNEWRCLWLSVERAPLPERAPTVRWAFEALARLGGCKKSSRLAAIGWLLLYRGWCSLLHRVIGFEMALALNRSEM